MSLNVDKVWLIKDNQEILIPATEVQIGDRIVVHMGNVIPFDGKVFAGTVVEEGEIKLIVNEVGGSSRFEKIVAMIEESEKLKSGLESKAEHLADKLVPYSLGATILTYLITRNVTKAISILMVDFSCIWRQLRRQIRLYLTKQER